MLVGGRYRILTKVSQKRTTTLYRGRDERSGGAVAIKRLDTVGLVKAADRRQAIDEFQREARRLISLRHPNIAPVLDYLVERETCYVTSAWVEGALLLDLHTQGPLSDSRIRSLGAQMADALSNLHGQQPPIIFRDLKMSHVVVDDQGNATLLDLGLTRFFKTGQAKGAAERGTAPYEAPEQAADGFASPRSDIYALGTILLALARGPAAGAAKALPISSALRQVLAVARQSDPAKRYAGAAEMRAALQAGAPLATSLPAPRQAVAAVKPPITLLTKTVRVVLHPDRRQVRYRVRLRNDSDEPIAARIKSSVPWLSPRAPELELPPGITQVEIVADLATAPRQPTSIARAIAVENGARIWIAAELVELEPKPELRDEVLDFGTVDAGLAELRLHVRNAGGGLLALRLSSPHEWLRLSLTDLALAGGQEAEVLVELDAARAPAGGEYARAISLDSDYGQTASAVRYDRGRPLLLLQPRQLDFGSLSEQQPAHTCLTVINHGTAALTLRARAGHPAVRVAPEAVTLPPKYKATLKVSLNVPSLPPGELALEEGVHLSSNAGAVSLPLRAVVRRAVLAASERSLDFGALQVEALASASRPLVISNRGNLPLTYQVQPLVSWLRTWPSEGRLDGGASTLLTVSLVPEALDRPGKRAADPAFVVQGDGVSLSVAASVDLVKPVLAVEPLSLDFGMIAAGGVRDVHAVVSNAGTGLLAWSASTDATWIELTPGEGECRGGESVVVTARAYALGLPAEARQARATIEFRAPRQTIQVQAAVAVSRPELTLEPRLDLGVSADFAPVSGRLLLFNRGVGELVGTAASRLPWLAVEPERFGIPSGGSLSLRVAAAPPAEVPPGATRLPGAIAIESNGGTAEVEIVLEIEAQPRVEVTPDRLVLKHGGEAVVVVRNSGIGTLRGRVSTSAPWLKARPERLTVKPGHRARVTVTAEASPEAGPLSGELVIGAGEQQGRVEVAVA